MKVANKKQMYKRLLSGRFGNIVQAWPSYADIEASGYRGHVSIRSKQTSNPVRLYHVPFDDLKAAVDGLPESYRKAGLMFSESPPDHKRTIQGELMRWEHGGYYLTYSYAPHPMRIAFDKQRLEARGLAAKMILLHHLSPVDYDELQGLLESYPDSVIEFSAFSCPVGIIPGRRMVIWEVRNY